MEALAAILPADALVKMKAIHDDDSLDSLARHDKVTEIFLSLPEDLQKKLNDLQTPGQYDNIPEEFRGKYKAVKEDKSLSFKEKCDKVREILVSMPEDVRAKVREAMKAKFSS